MNERMQEEAINANYNAYAKVSTRGRVFLAKFQRVFSIITFASYIISYLEGLWR